MGGGESDHMDTNYDQDHCQVFCVFFWTKGENIGYGLIHPEIRRKQAIFKIIDDAWFWRLILMLTCWGGGGLGRFFEDSREAIFKIIDDAWFWHLIVTLDFDAYLTLDFDAWFWRLILTLDFDA